MSAVRRLAAAVLAAAALLACALPAQSVPAPEEPFAVLEGKGAQIQQAWLEARVKELASRPAPKTLEEAADRTAIGRRNLMRSLGLDPLPPRTQLNARVTGVLDREGYRIEKVAFESRPGFHVTAHLYVPDGDGPFPVILNPHGHWGWKKTEPVVQARLIAMAKHGFLAMIVDSPGGSYEDGNPVERRQQGSHNDWRLAMSVGTATGIYVWDLMRALDYLETRPEADATRVGITGASGGGTATTYAFAADERIDCAVPVVYATSLAVNPHNGCLCNHVPGTLRIGDRADVLALRAPAPVLVIGAEDDPEFPPEGTRLTGEKLEKLWRLHGAEDAVDAIVFPGRHDYGKAMREAAMGFFDLHLRGRGDGSPLAEPPIVTEPPDAAELVVLPEWPAESRTMLDLARAELATKFPNRNGPFWTGAEIPLAEPVRTVVREEGGRKWLRIGGKGMVDVPVVLWMPEGEPRGLLFLTDDGGKERAAERFGARELAARGFACAALDLPGIGELSGMDQRLANYVGSGPMPIAAYHFIPVRRMVRHSHEAWRNLPYAILAAGPVSTATMMIMPSWENPPAKLAVMLDTLSSWEDLFDADVSHLAAQPFASLGRTFDAMRVSPNVPLVYSVRGAAEPDWRASLW